MPGLLELSRLSGRLYKMDTDLPVSKLDGPYKDTVKDGVLDNGVGHYVNTLRREGIETFESCEGGPGHAYPECTIAFHGNRSEGHKALSIAMTYDFPVSDLRRVWSIIDGEATGPSWEMVFKFPHKGQYFNPS